MSVRLEWTEVRDADPFVVGRGEEAPDGQTIEGDSELALVIGGTAIEGSREDLLSLLETAKDLVRSPVVPTPGWKIVELRALVRDVYAEDLHETYGRMTEHDECSGAVIETRDLAADEALMFGEEIEDAAE